MVVNILNSMFAENQLSGDPTFCSSTPCLHLQLSKCPEAIDVSVLADVRLASKVDNLAEKETTKEIIVAAPQFYFCNDTTHDAIIL